MQEYINLFNHNPTPTWIYTKDSFQIVEVNVSALNLYNFSREEFLAKTALEIFIKEEISAFQSINNSLHSLDQNIPFGNFSHLDKNEKSIQVEMSGHQLIYKGQTCVLVFCKEIAVEENILRSCQEVLNIMDASLDVICAINEEGKFIRLSAASQSLWGYAPEELVGTPYIDLVHHEDVESTTQIAADIVAGKNVTTFENRYIKKNGDIAYNLWSARWDDTTKTMYVIARDVSDRKEKEGILIESETRFKALVQEGSDLIAILDENSIYKYVSPTSTSILGIPPEEFIGRSAFEFIHPEDAERTRECLVKITTQDRVLIEPFRFQNKEGKWRWLESILTNLTDHPSIKGIVANSRDITNLKEEEHRLKLLESVVMNTRDTILITEAEPQNEPGPRILFVNPAFTEMTGYSSDEVLGKTPRILQGPKSDRRELDKLSASMKRWEPCEITTVNYKKNGEEFWVNFRISPVANEKGWYTHWIAIEKDVTEIKNDEIQRELLSLISEEFKLGVDLYSSLQGLCKLIAHFDNFSFCEIWLPSFTNDKIRLYSKHVNNKEAELFYTHANFQNELSLEDGLPGIVWKEKQTIIWDDLESNTQFVRKNAANKSGLKTVMGLPLFNDDVIVGVIVLGTNLNKDEFYRSNPVFEKLKDFIGSEIHRKKLEDDQRHLFEALPNLICIIDFKGVFLKINKAGCDILGYEEWELIGKSFDDFVHPEDVNISKEEVQKLKEGNTVFNFENRYITKSGKIIWLNWHCNSNRNDGIIFATAKNITSEKKLKELIHGASSLAIIGGWEIDPINNVLIWSDIIHNIYETDRHDYQPELENAIEFYRADFRDMVKDKIEQAQLHGVSFDYEAILITAKGNEKWVRAIGQSEFVDGKCIRLFGSFQDINERKLLDDKLNEILRSITDAFYAVDENWNFTYFNREAERLLKKKSQDVLGKNLWEIFPAAKGTSLETIYKNVASEKVAQNFEYFYPGDNSWYELTAYPSSGGLASYFKNIDAKKIAAEELNKAYLEKNQILESIGDAFFAVDNDWTVTYWNRVAEEILSKSKDEIVGKNLWTVYADAVDTLFYKKYHEAKHTGKVVTIEDYYLTLDKWFEVTVYPSENGLSVYFKDVTLRKKTDIKIQQANERFEKVTQATTDAIWDWDIENDVFYRGNGFEKLFGYEVKKKLHSIDFWTDRFHPDDLIKIKQSLYDSLNNSEVEYWEEEYRIIHSSKIHKTVIDKGMIIRDTSGKATRMVGAITDVTERKRYEMELRKLNEELTNHASKLEQTNNQLEQFAYIASHDLQEPLRMISSFLTLLTRKYSGQLDEKALQYIYFADDGAKRMKQIILDLLDYSRAGKFIDEHEEIDLHELVNEYTILRRKVIEEKNVVLKFNLPAKIIGLKTPLKQTVHCLLDNAIKYSKPTISPIVEVDVVEDERCWTFKVKDNGVGIDNQFFDKIFIIFQRLHNRDEYDGTGVGLAISKKIVESWGGKIWVESVPGEGSIFYFTIIKPKA